MDLQHHFHANIANSLVGPFYGIHTTKNCLIIYRLEEREREQGSEKDSDEEKKCF